MQAENLAQAANLIWGFDPKVIATAIVVDRLQYHLPAGRNDDHCRHFGKIRHVPICGHLGCSES